MPKVKILIISSVVFTSLTVGSVAGRVAATPPDGQSCSPGSGNFFGLDSWDYFLQDHYYYEGGVCGFHESFVTTTKDSNGNDQVNGLSSSGLSSIWLIVLAVFEDLLRIAGMVAVVMVIVGGVRYMISTGSPEAVKGAQATILNALIGVAIAVVAAGTVQFLGHTLGGS